MHPKDEEQAKAPAEKPLPDLKKRFPLSQVDKLSDQLLRRFDRLCERIAVAGSVRRRKPQVGDIEIVAIPKWLEGSDLFGPGASAVNLLWKELDGICFNGPDAKYVKAGDYYRQVVARTPDGKHVKIDFFTAAPGNWGWIYLLRTGSDKFSRHVAACLNKAGYTSKKGWIRPVGKLGKKIATPTEADVFKMAKLKPVEPEKRSW